MASPFRHFRKHAKPFFAVAAVLAIFIFVLGTALQPGRSDSQSTGGNEIAAEWEGGSLTQRELYQLAQKRAVVDEVLQRLFSQGGGRYVYDLPSSVPPLLLRAEVRENHEALENEVIRTEIEASRAQEAGITVSDDVINYYLQEFGLNKVGPEELRTIMSSVGGRSARANEAIVFETLRKMLMAHFYQRSYLDAAQVVLPQERWEDWLRVNERISLQAAILPTESFLEQVSAPTEGQLQAFYNDYKNNEPGVIVEVGGKQMPAPTPGFAEPRRVRLQLLTANLADRTEKFLDKVTDAEIADYYERNKRLEFIKLNLPEEPPEGETPSATEPTTEATPPAEGEQPAESPAGDAAPAEGADAAPTDPAPAADADAAPSEAAPSNSAPAESPTTEPAAPTEEKPTEEKQSRVGSSSPFRLVAFQDTPAEPATTPTENAAADTADATATAPTTTDSPSEEPAESSSAPNDATAPAPTASAGPATSEAPSASTSSGAAVDPAALTGGESTAPAAEEEVEYEPLEKVSDDIRRELAKEKAVDELKRIMNEATAQVQAEYNRFHSRVIVAEEALRENPKANVTMPKPPAKLTDLSWLAKSYGLEYEKMAALTIRELSEAVVGRSTDPAGQVSVTAAAFYKLELFEPFLAQNRIDGDWRLVMKTEDVARRIPPYDEIKAEVKTAWTLREAAKLAEKKAKELAEQAEKSDQPFDQFIAGKGYQVVKQTGFFSWRSYPAGGGGEGVPPSLSDVPELKNVGPDFMRTAFGLGGNETAGLLNFDHSAAYVIRLHSRQYLPEELQKLFLEEVNSWPGRSDMLLERFYRFNAPLSADVQRVIQESQERRAANRKDSDSAG